MADNDEKVAERSATTDQRRDYGTSENPQTREESKSGARTSGANDDKKDVEKRGQANRRGPGKDKNNGSNSSLDFDVDSPVSVLGGYMEEGTRRPEPYAQYGTIDTTGTGGGSPDMSEVTPVFQEARARSMVTAARALDPTDRAVPRELVTLPERAEDREVARDELFAAAEDAVSNPIELGGLTPAQRDAAEEYDDSEGSRATLGGQVAGASTGSGGKRHDQKSSLRDLDGDGADDRDELKQDAAEVKATVSQGSTGRRQQAATQQGAQQAQGR